MGLFALVAVLTQVSVGWKGGKHGTGFLVPDLPFSLLSSSPIPSAPVRPIFRAYVDAPYF